MKKIIAILLCALLAIPAAGALAESPFDGFSTPNPYERAPEAPPADEPAADGTFPLQIDGQTIRLRYDSAPQYSSIQDGLVQASYYAYGDDGVMLYELYLIFPDTARAGMVFTPEYAMLTNEECSVVLIVSGNGKETYYSSSLINGSVFPSGSTFSISITDIRPDGDATAYSGSLSATLLTTNSNFGEEPAVLEIPATPFSFSVGGDSKDNDKGAKPRATQAPADLYKV